MCLYLLCCWYSNLLYKNNNQFMSKKCRNTISPSQRRNIFYIQCLKLRYKRFPPSEYTNFCVNISISRRYSVYNVIICRRYNIMGKERYCRYPLSSFCTSAACMSSYFLHCYVKMADAWVAPVSCPPLMGNAALVYSLIYSRTLIMVLVAGLRTRGK